MQITLNLNILMGILLAIEGTWTSLSGQVISLHEKNGFKDFTLGEPLSKYSGDLKYDTRDNDRVVYSYTGFCCKKMFDYDVDEIKLVFYKSKLAAIEVWLAGWGQAQSQQQYVDNFLQDFSYYFGEAANLKLFPKDNVVAHAIWKDGNVQLDAVISYLDWDTGYQPLIIIYDSVYNDERIKDGF